MAHIFLKKVYYCPMKCYFSFLDIYIYMYIYSGQIYIYTLEFFLLHISLKTVSDHPFNFSSSISFLPIAPHASQCVRHILLFGWFHLWTHFLWQTVNMLNVSFMIELGRVIIFLYMWLVYFYRVLTGSGVTKMSQICYLSLRSLTV